MTAAPSYWVNSNRSDDYFEWVDCDAEVLEGIQALLDASVKVAWTRDRGFQDGGRGRRKPVPVGFEALSVQRNENSRIWRKYALKKALIKGSLSVEDVALQEYAVKTALVGTLSFMSDAPLDPSCNEWFLWHGTSYETAKLICEIDFKQKYAGSTTGMLYGPGTYFADSCTKADEYARESTEGDGVFTMLLCRVMGGLVMYTDEVEPNAADLTDACLHGPYDSVLGDREKCRDTFKEYMVYGSDQCYPEYVVSYKRKWKCE